MELGHLLTRSGLMYPEVSSKVYHDSFCQLGSSEFSNSYINNNLWHFPSEHTLYFYAQFIKMY